MFASRKSRIVGLALALPLALAACTSSSGGGGASGDATNAASGGSGGSGSYGYNIAVVTHGPAGDAFWDVVKNGATQAGKDMGIKLSYQSDGDAQKQSQLIDAAVNQKVDGLVVSMANPDALKGSIEKAVSAGIPVITINAGEDRSAEFGAQTHVGQNETVAGEAAGAKLKAEGVKNLICVIQEAGNVALETRCKSAAEGLGGKTTNLQVQNSDPTAAQATIKAKLQQDTSIDGVLTLGGQMAKVASGAITDAGSKAKLGTFDVNSDVTQLIQDGKLDFAIDQQPYLQGYLPVVMLTLFKSNGNVVGGGQPVLTGPSFVTKDNVDQVAGLAAKGTR